MDPTAARRIGVDTLIRAGASLDGLGGSAVALKIGRNRIPNYLSALRMWRIGNITAAKRVFSHHFVLRALPVDLPGYSIPLGFYGGREEE
jgi:hypothetical protein